MGCSKKRGKEESTVTFGVVYQKVHTGKRQQFFSTDSSTIGYSSTDKTMACTAPFLIAILAAVE